MKTSLGLSAFGLILSLSACAQSPQANTRPDQAALTPTSLIVGAEAHRGKTITLQGYFIWRTDTRALWESKDAYLDAEQQRKGSGYNYWAKCVTVYPAAKSWKAARKLTDRVVRITGKVTILDRDSLWACNAVAIEDAVISPA